MLDTTKVSSNYFCYVLRKNEFKFLLSIVVGSATVPTWTSFGTVNVGYRPPALTFGHLVANNNVSGSKNGIVAIAGNGDMQSNAILNAGETYIIEADFPI